MPNMGLTDILDWSLRKICCILLIRDAQAFKILLGIPS
jgi:hypothetical protein